LGWTIKKRRITMNDYLMVGLAFVLIVGLLVLGLQGLAPEVLRIFGAALAALVGYFVGKQQQGNNKPRPNGKPSGKKVPSK
jgi:hypothetical protein